MPILIILAAVTCLAAMNNKSTKLVDSIVYIDRAKEPICTIESSEEILESHEDLDEEETEQEVTDKDIKDFSSEILSNINEE